MAGVTAGLPRRGPGLRTGAALLLAVLIAGAGALLAVERHAEAERRAAEATAFAIAGAGAAAAAQHVSRTLEWVETLHALGAALWRARLGEQAADEALLAAHLSSVTAEPRLAVLQVAVIDAAGRLGWSTVPGFAPVDLSDREHFRVHREGRAGPFVSQPLVGRASGRWSVQVTRPVVGRDGGFAGVVVVSLDPLLLSRDLAELKVIEGAHAAVLRMDGTILARSSEPERFLGQKGGPQAGAMAEGPPEGRLRLDRDLSGVARLLAFHTLPEHGLGVFFALPEERFGGEVARVRQSLRAAVVAATVAVGAAGLLVLTLCGRAAERAEAARQEAGRRRSDALLEALPGAAYRGVVDEKGRFTRLSVSSAIARMTGFPLAELTPPGAIAALMDAETRQHRGEFWRRIRAAGEQVQEVRLRTADDRWIWIREHCRLVGPAGPGPAEVVGLITDITAERQLRARAVAGAKLATLGEMATGVAHELNQPAATIALAADIAALELSRGDPRLLPAIAGRLEEIARQTMRMRDVIDHFRIFGRAESGPEDGPVAVERAVAGALTIAAGALNGSGIRVVRDIPAGLPPVRARLVALEQVLVNAIGNARDAMRQTGHEARLLSIAARHDAAAGEVVIAVRDRGPGIPPAILDRVFEPFFTTKPVGEGTGLGLAIAYGTIRGFGGTIALENRAEGGAELLIRLPEHDRRSPDRETAPGASAHA